MATLLQNGVTTLTLPDMLWEDEFAWQAVQGTLQHAVAGSLMIDRGAKLAGRPITLGGPFLSLSQVQTLFAWASSATATLTLTLRGVAYAVIFTPVGAALDARPLFQQDTYQSTDPYSVRIRLVTTA